MPRAPRTTKEPSLKKIVAIKMSKLSEGRETIQQNHEALLKALEGFSTKAMVINTLTQNTKAIRIKFRALLDDVIFIIQPSATAEGKYTISHKTDDPTWRPSVYSYEAVINILADYVILAMEIHTGASDV